jgi:hypothetical protein
VHAEDGEVRDEACHMEGETETGQVRCLLFSTFSSTIVSGDGGEREGSLTISPYRAAILTRTVSSSRCHTLRCRRSADGIVAKGRRRDTHCHVTNPPSRNAL